MKTIGLIVNPIAGMGGKVGLKGTDGKDILETAILLGASPVAPARAERFLATLKPVNGKIDLFVGAGDMGEHEAEKVGLEYKVVGSRKGYTTADDTKQIAENMMKNGVTLIAFCGGDGTARDILDVVDSKTPVLGIPTGVKMHSAAFAVNPESAARIAKGFLQNHMQLREVEIMDVDEQSFREGRLSARLYGYVLVPYEPRLIQGAKIASPMTEDELQNQAALAIYVIEEMKPDVIYIVGPGTTTRTIADLLDQKKTLLGVDLFCNKSIIAHDVSERKILEKIKGREAKVIVTPIGGQGFIFGRGNQQISSSVIRQVGIENIVVIGTKQKLSELTCLRADTGDPDLDAQLRGYIRVVTDYREEHMMRIE